MSRLEQMLDDVKKGNIKPSDIANEDLQDFRSRKRAFSDSESEEYESEVGSIHQGTLGRASQRKRSQTPDERQEKSPDLSGVGSFQPFAGEAPEHGRTGLGPSGTESQPHRRLAVSGLLNVPEPVETPTLWTRPTRIEDWSFLALAAAIEVPFLAEPVIYNSLMLTFLPHLHVANHAHPPSLLPPPSA